MKSIVLPLLCHLQGLANSENLSTSWQPPARTEAGLWAAWFGNIAGIWYSYLLCKSANMTGTSQNRRQALKENWAVCCNKNKDCSDLTHFGVTAFTHHSDFLFEKRQSVAKYKVQNSWHLPSFAHLRNGTFPWQTEPQQHSWPFGITAQAFPQFGQSFFFQKPTSGKYQQNSQLSVHLLPLFAVRNSVFRLKAQSTVIQKKEFD